MEDIPSGLGLVAADNEAPVDFTARQAFSQGGSQDPATRISNLGSETTSRKQGEIKVILERHQMEQEAEEGRGGRGGRKGDTSITSNESHVFFSRQTTDGCA